MASKSRCPKTTVEQKRDAYDDLVTALTGSWGATMAAIDAEYEDVEQ